MMYIHMHVQFYCWQHSAVVATDGSTFRSFLHETIQNITRTNTGEDYEIYMGKTHTMAVMWK
jgi:hypothetical protein